MKHLPFDSVYRQDFEVVEQRIGNIRLYPHTDQLPILLRALNHEFYGGLPPRIARVDHRGTGFDKIVLRMSAMMFCNYINSHRKDDVRLLELPSPDLVSKVCIVQQITEHTPMGACHRFKFYAGALFQEVRMSGKRLVFADHVLQRFSARVPNKISNDLSELLLTFFGGTLVAMRTGASRSFVVTFGDSLLAFPFKESADEFFITTCLSINELPSLEIELPPFVVNLHYSDTFALPKLRNWSPTLTVQERHARWRRKSPLPPAEPMAKELSWGNIAYWIRDEERRQGHGDGSRLVFQDHIPGPNVFDFKPGEQEPLGDDLQFLKQTMPDVDWDALVADREREREEINSRKS